MNIIAFGAHPDDIEIGMGGALAKFVQNGHKVTGIIATIPGKKEKRWDEAKKAADILGINIELLEIDFANLFFSRALVKILDEWILTYKPDIIFTHWNNDSHQDHNALTNGVIAAARKNTCSVYMYEQTLPGGIVPNHFNAQMYIDISQYIDLKIKSINAHDSQLRRNGSYWIQGVKSRAIFRGSQINTNYAEAFQVIKEIYKI